MQCQHFFAIKLLRCYLGTRYLVLFRGEKLISFKTELVILKGQKVGITYVISHNYANIKVDSYDSLPLEKALTFHNVIIHIKSVWNISYLKTTIIKKFLYKL